MIVATEPELGAGAPQEEHESASKRVCAQAKTCDEQEVSETTNGLANIFFSSITLLIPKTKD